MDGDALRLYDEDRQRFLAIHLEFLNNAALPSGVRAEEARGTENAIRQLRELNSGSDRG